MLVETQPVTAETGAPTRIAPSTSFAEIGQKLAKFTLLVAQLLLLAILVQRFQLESPAFEQLTYLVFGGFIVHYWLPLRFRLPFFLCLSLAGTVMVLGAVTAAWLIGVGVVLIAICHLPVSYWTRAGILLGLGVLFAAMRLNWIPAPWPMAVWPILASMFMFRLLVYLYDVTHRTAPTSFASSLSYFFMLPNVCFPLFPVVDYQSFVENYYDADRNQIHLVGVRWIFRGVVHLILYRILYKNYAIGLYDVANLGDLVHYCLWLFLLYLRVSGQFHVIVGMLHLFGFNLAETHHLYYLASSFSDFWRRINIYWKDFMMKLYFYPVFFRLRSRGSTMAMVVATVVVFVLTWFLHALQWFWLRGTFLIAANDVLFWSILAVLVIVNSLIELKYGRQRALTAGDISWGGAIRLGIQTLATFTVICVLWSLWTSESLTAWLTLWQFALVPPTAKGWILIGTTVAVVFGAAVYVARRPVSWRPAFVHESLVRCVLMTLLAALSISAIDQRLGRVGNLIGSARTEGLNAVEMVDLERGYYENLLAVDRFNGELWRLYARRPLEWTLPFTEVGLSVPTHDVRRYRLKSLAEAMSNGVIVRTNRWGMHDKDYEQKRPSDVYRIALLGASHAMAVGVEDQDDFESLVEDRINHERDGKSPTYEILNFAVAGHNPICQIWVLRDEVLPFEPNMVFYVGHPHDERRVVDELIRLVVENEQIPDPFLRNLLRRAEVDSDTPEPIIRRRLAPFGNELLTWVFSTFGKLCESHDIPAVYILLPVLGTMDDVPNVELIKRSGFTLADLRGVYDSYPHESLYLAEWDQHPNTKAHKLLADRLYEILREKQAIPLFNGATPIREPTVTPAASAVKAEQ